MTEIIIIVILILLNGIFAMSEIAVISARKSSLSTDIKKGSRSARYALKLANEPDRFLSTVQIGITLIGILTGLYSGETLAGDLAVFIAYIPELELQDVKRAVAVVVGPPAMMKFSVMGLLQRGFQEENIWISHERKMCCGIGKCGHCKINDSYVCLDGPVYNYTVGSQLLD